LRPRSAAIRAAASTSPLGTSPSRYRRERLWRHADSGPRRLLRAALPACRRRRPCGHAGLVEMGGALRQSFHSPCQYPYGNANRTGRSVVNKSAAGGELSMASNPRVLPQEPIRRYSNWAVTFHWVTVALVLAPGLSPASPSPGLMQGPGRDLSYYTWHKTRGCADPPDPRWRGGYRLVNPPPAFHQTCRTGNRSRRSGSHRLFLLPAHRHAS
jgi:hypothetical protein